MVETKEGPYEQLSCRAGDTPKTSCVFESDELTSLRRTLLTGLFVHLRAIEERTDFIEISIQSFMKRSTLCGKIARMPGIGPITATAIVAAVGDARQFCNGRHLAAC